MAALTLFPVLLALGLLLFGDYGNHRAPAMTVGRVAPVVAVAFVLGPLPVLLFGFWAWLALVVLVIGATLIFAMLRTPRTPPLRH
jgi:hypothetical protein